MSKNNDVKRICIETTKQRVKVLDAYAETVHQDRHTILNKMMLDYFLRVLEPDYQDRIREIYY